MRIYPALRAQMGDWDYFIVRMKMREVAQEIQFAEDIHDDFALNEAIQRELKTGRVKRDLVGFLAGRQDRFFSSIVVAARHGEPAWFPVKMDEGVVPEVFARSNALRDSFGVLSFGDDPQYYALDGQHRVAAVKLLLEGNADFECPEGFENEMLSVIVVLREAFDGTEKDWMKRYRRLFSSLNRWAKPTGIDTNIIMDEDDRFAILTRRLISGHEFFRSPGREKDSERIKMKGASLRSGSNAFTTLRTLYLINRVLLTSRKRVAQDRWPVPKSRGAFLQRRPSEDVLDALFEELVTYWNCLLAAVPALEISPNRMRRHVLAETEAGQWRDHLLFWPIGQELFATVARRLLDDAAGAECALEREEVARCLRPFSRVRWDLHKAPWRHILLTGPHEDGQWKMRNEERKEAVELSHRMLYWLCTEESPDKEARLRREWQRLLVRRPVDEVIEVLWRDVKDLRSRVLNHGVVPKE